MQHAGNDRHGDAAAQQQRGKFRPALVCQLGQRRIDGFGQSAFGPSCFAGFHRESIVGLWTRAGLSLRKRARRPMLGRIVPVARDCMRAPTQRVVQLELFAQ